MQQIKADVRYFCIFLPHICSVILFSYYYNKKSVIQSLVLYQSLGIPVDFPTAFLLSLVSSLSACGASGVAGGSLLLIPLACSLFGIPNDTAMQVVGVGFIIGVIQDSCETALNSSSDVLFTAAAEYRARRKADTKCTGRKQHRQMRHSSS